MYKNLKAEMLKQDITVNDIAVAINKKADTAVRKINGQINITIEEAKLIAALFKKDRNSVTRFLGLEYLFER